MALRAATPGPRVEDVASWPTNSSRSRPFVEENLCVIRHYDVVVDDVALLEALRVGDERAFRELVTRYQTSMTRVARYYVRSDATAEDVVQETWVAVLRGLERFEGRSTFKTWLFHVLVNRARTIAAREARDVPADASDDASALGRRFNEGGMWTDPPTPFTELIDNGIANERMIRLVHDAIARLGEPHQAVVTLRDVEGLTNGEIAQLLELSEANVRVILHRGRTKVRAHVETSLRGGTR